VAECPLQLEARTTAIRTAADGGLFVVEAEVLAVHADASIVIAGIEYVDLRAWDPLIYNFCHYFGLGDPARHSFRSETPTGNPERDSSTGSR
jgi:flavin reductase (DIM6/NTAB) family NADH-FMN oxidoreductase RutF